MMVGPKCQVAIARHDDSVQCDTCKMLLHTVCSKINKNSLEYLRSARSTAMDSDTKIIIKRLDEVIRNQVTTNDTLTALNNRVIELEKSLKEKDKIIQSQNYSKLFNVRLRLRLRFKINVLEQDERSCFVDISGVKIEKEEKVDNLVHEIAAALEIDLNKSDVEKA